LSGETQNEPSGWTSDLLKQHYDARLIDLALRLDQRFNAQQAGVDAALTSAEKAVAKAEGANERRFDSVNEFRQQLNDQAATFARMDYLQQALEARDALLGSQNERIRELELAQRSSSGSKEGGQAKAVDFRAQLAAYLAVATLVLGLVIFMANYLTSK
jgi:hypothetical protein